MVDSPFQKGGVDQNYPLYYCISALVIAIVYLADFNILIKAEIIVFSGLISIVAVITAFYSTHFLLNYIFGFDYQIKILWDNTNKILANIIVFNIPNLLMTLTAYAILKYKQ